MEYKEYNPSHLDQVVDLLNICFPKKQISKKTFLWKHYDKVFKKTLGMVAIDREKICSFVCFTPIVISKDNNIYQNFYSCAVQATHPDYRRQGLVSKLTQLVEKKLGNNIGYIGFSNTNGVKIDRFSKNINYRILGQMASQYVLSLPYKTNLKITKTDSIFLQTTIASNYYGIFKNNDYFNWRYTRNPKNQFLYFSITKNANIIGYIVCKNQKTRYEVMELLFNKFDSKTYNETIKAFANYAFYHRKTITSYSYLQNAFWSNQFPFISLKKKISIYFTIKSQDNHFLKLDDWIIQSGDIQ